MQAKDFANKARIILKKGCFFYLELQEICEQLNEEEYESDPPIRTEMLNTEMQEPRTKNEKPESKCQVLKTETQHIAIPSNRYQETK